MSENKNLVYILGGVIAVLVAFAGYLVYRNLTAVPAVDNTAGQAAAAADAAATAADAAATGGTTGMAGNTAIESSAFDPKTATKVTLADPNAHLKAYHDAVVAKKFDTAYEMLPLSMQQRYGDAKSFAEQVAGYGITEYSLGTATTQGDVMTVAATQNTPQMPITYTWTFTKSGGAWYCTDRKMGG